MISLVDVVEVRPMAGFKLWVRFSDGSEGVRDYAEFIANGGPMVEPLRNQAFFDRVFLSFGVPTWPNGFDVDAVNLQAEIRDRGDLLDVAA